MMMLFFLLFLAVFTIPFLFHLVVSSSLSKSRETLQNKDHDHSLFSLSTMIPSLGLVYKKLIRFVGVCRIPSDIEQHAQRNEPSSHVSVGIDTKPGTSSQANSLQFLRTRSFPSVSTTGIVAHSLPESSNNYINSSVSGATLYMNTTRHGFQCHVIDIRTLQRDQLNQIMEDREMVAAARKSLGKTTVGVTYQAATALMIFYYQSLVSPSTTDHGGSGSSSAPLPLPIRIIGNVTVIGFSASLIGILLHKQHPVLAAICEKLGSASAALGFFITMSVLLPGIISQLIGWFAATVSFIAFTYALIKMK